MTNWKETTLGEAAEIVKDAWKPGGAVSKYIGLEHIAEGSLTLNSFGSSKDLESNKFKFKAGDILFGKLRPYFRKVVILNFEGVCSTDIWVVRAKEGFDQRYLFYFMANPAFVGRSMGASTGTHMPRASWDFLKDTRWHFPSLPEQKEIAGILSSLDDKIELLREENKTLEATAQAIFKEWFVNFNFPNAEGKPYKSSGGKMIDSELSKIPEGWRDGTLSEIAKVDWGNTALTKSSYIQNGKFLGVSAAGCDGRMEHKEYDFGAIVISAIGEYCGRLFFPMEDFTAIKNTLVVKERNSKTSYFIYFGLQIWKLERRGAAQPFLSKGDTEKIEIIIPTENILEDFRKFADSIFQKIKNNNSKIQILSTLRDTLLPKLMSGGVQVEGLDI